MDCLSTVKAKHFILISTIDVYSSFIPSPDESSIPDETRQDAYGKNRYQLECWVRKHFPSSLIVRLPALFANGLKKNFIFDLMHPLPSMISAGKWMELVSSLKDEEVKRLEAVYEEEGTTTISSTENLRQLNKKRLSIYSKDPISRHGTLQTAAVSFLFWIFQISGH